MLTKDKAGVHRGKWTWELSQKAERQGLSEGLPTDSTPLP